MGYGIMAWRIDVPSLVAQVGSGTEKLPLWRKNMSARFEASDQRFATEIRDGAPTLAQAVEAILTDRIPARGHGFQYAYAIELLGRMHGAPMDNASFYPCPLDRLDAFDRELQRAGVPKELCVGAVLRAGPPLLLPPVDDLPIVGHLLRANIENAIDAVQPATRTIAAEHTAAAKTYLGWLFGCMDASQDLVLFYY